jgi:acyl-CoA dehydrogenase
MRTDPIDTFRREVRAWLHENCPAEMRRTSHEEPCFGGRRWTFRSSAQRQWLERMAQRGWTAPQWPKAYGGGGLGDEEAAVLREELARIEAPPALSGPGILVLAPVLLKYGTEEQKRIHLPPIARGETLWCQGYSEPNAGSDLASLKTRADDGGDYFIVTGQKIWTSYAHQADWMYCLVRTAWSAPKHAGISFLLIDMSSAGICARQIALISGKASFCETTLANVKVPKENLVGALHGGWEIAKYLLERERSSLGSVGSYFDAAALSRAANRAASKQGGALANPLLRADVIRAEIDRHALDLTIRRYRDEAVKGESAPGAKAPILKFCGAELHKRRTSLLMSIAGSDGLEWEGAHSRGGALARQWLGAKAYSIAGGTSEIMLEIIARRLLQLPTVKSE